MKKWEKGEIYGTVFNVTKDPILLVDSDNAGLELYDYLKDNNNIEIIQLKEINQNFKEIEDVFSKEDREKYSFINEKKYHSSINFKNHINEFKDSLTEETVNNFKKLLDRLLS